MPMEFGDGLCYDTIVPPQFELGEFINWKKNENEDLFPNGHRKLVCLNGGVQSLQRQKAIEGANSKTLSTQ